MLRNCFLFQVLVGQVLVALILVLVGPVLDNIAAYLKLLWVWVSFMKGKERRREEGRLDMRMQPISYWHERPNSHYAI